VSRSVIALAGLLMVGAWTSGPVTASPSTAPARWAATSLQASVSQGFNFQKDAQDIIGHINYLKIGDTEMASDLNVTDPESIANYVKVFGVASGIHWNGGYAEPVQFSAQVSVDNKNKLATLQHKSMANTEVELRFTFYDWDPKQKKYYKAFHTNAVKVKGLVQKSGGSLMMNIDMTQSSEVVSPKNHAFTLGVVPADVAQQLHLAVSVEGKMVKAWGVTVAK
jgi:hypothetical protein